MESIFNNRGCLDLGISWTFAHISCVTMLIHCALIC